MHAGRKTIGRIAEALYSRHLLDQGYTDLVAIQNKSGHGIDLCARNPQGELEWFEIKGTGRGQRRLPDSEGQGFVESRLRRALSETGQWAEHSFSAELRGIASRLQEESTDPVTRRLRDINAKWINVELTRVDGKLQSEFHVMDWAKPSPRAHLNLEDHGQPTHPLWASFQHGSRVVPGLDRTQQDNVAAALLFAYVRDPVMKRVDNFVLGNPLPDGRQNLFALYSPFGERGPHFTTQVDINTAAHKPAEQTLALVNTLPREVPSQDQQNPMSFDTPGGPRRS